MTQVRRQLLRAAPPRTLNALFSLERATERQLGGANFEPAASGWIRLLRKSEGRGNGLWNFTDRLLPGDGSLKVTAADFCHAPGH